MSFEIHPDTPAPDTIREAVARLTPETRGRWGTLNSTGMLEHVARFHEIYLGRRLAPWPVRVLARLIGRPMIGKFLATSPFKMQRGMRTLPGLRIDTREVRAESFEAERAQMLETFEEIHALMGEVAHPLYGRIDADVVKALTRHHAAHHLSQFGVLESGDPEGQSRIDPPVE
ncbi:MAG: DUF1569 domain-containing protein [Longimicrobiales bacterium]